MDSISSSADIHVLAVDDSLLDRKVVERLLKNSSYKVTAVDSALRALEVLGMVGTPINSFNINLIITDYCMPEMTGYDLLKRVKESSALKEIPVVIMSSENVPSRIKMCMAEGAEEFIIKPLRLADVKRLRGFIYQGSESCLKRKAEGCFEALTTYTKRQVTSARLRSGDDTGESSGVATECARLGPGTEVGVASLDDVVVEGTSRSSSKEEDEAEAYGGGENMERRATMINQVDSQKEVVIGQCTSFMTSKVGENNSLVMEERKAAAAGATTRISEHADADTNVEVFLTRTKTTTTTTTFCNGEKEEESPEEERSPHTAGRR